MTTELKAEGRVIETDRKEGANARGPWIMWRLKIQSEEGSFWYSTFADEGRDVTAGQDLSIAYVLRENKENSQYPHRNITSLMPITPREAGRVGLDQVRDGLAKITNDRANERAIEKADEKTMLPDHPSKRRSIERQVALSKAIDLIIGHGDIKQMNVEEAITWAESFYLWIIQPSAPTHLPVADEPPNDYEPGSPDRDFQI